MFNSRDLDQDRARKLLEYEQRYQALLKYNACGIFALDLQGNFTEVNDIFATMLGYLSEDIRLMNFRDIFLEFDLTGAVESFHAALHHQALDKMEVVMIHKDRHSIHVTFTLVPIILNDELIGLNGMIHDITDKKKGEEEIGKLHHLNELILNSAGEGIYTIDKNHQTVFWNLTAEKLTGFSATEVYGKSLHSMLHHTKADGSHYPIEDCPISKAVHNGNEYKGMNELFWRKDGTCFPAEYTVIPIKDEDTIIGSVVTFRDLSEKIETEELLRQSEKLSVVGQLAAGIAHEIRNPLTALKGFMQLLKPTMNQEQRNYFDIMQGEMDRIEFISSELLVLSKPQALFFTRKNLKPILENAISILMPQATMFNVDIVTDLQSTPEMDCEGNQLKQVFVNLIKNGIEAMPGGGLLTVKLDQIDNQVRLQFVDQGEGIAEGVLSKLGEPFYSTKKEGTGLGIVVTKRIIETHKGTIEFVSKLGMGTTVVLKLPVYQTHHFNNLS